MPLSRTAFSTAADRLSGFHASVRGNTLPFVQTDDCSLYYEVDGPINGPTLLLSNSLATDLRMWEGQIRAFAEHFRVVRYDCRGHGRSEVPYGPYSMERFGRDALTILDNLRIESFSYCGMSMGGMVGQWLGFNAGGRLQKLVLSNTNYRYRDKTPWDERISIARRDGLEALADTIMKRWFTSEFRAESPATVSFIRRMFVSTPIDGYVASCAAIREIDFERSNTYIDAPTLVIVGEQDPATRPSDGRTIHQQISNSQIVQLNAAHMSNIERPEQYTDAVLKFLLPLS